MRALRRSGGRDALPPEAPSREKKGKSQGNVPLWREGILPSTRPKGAQVMHRLYFPARTQATVNNRRHGETRRNGMEPGMVDGLRGVL